MCCLPQSPSPSQAIQDRLRKRQRLREKFKEAFDEIKELVTMCMYSRNVIHFSLHLLVKIWGLCIKAYKLVEARFAIR